MGETNGLTINTEKNVTYTQKEEAYVILNRDWKRVKAYINKLHDLSSTWNSVAWGSLGIGISCMASWFTNQFSLAFLIIGVIGICVAICSFIASKSNTKHFEGSVDNLKEVVNEIEEFMVPHKEND